eukprot:TRINITY_DN12279_c0_g1_i1.p1 TRINITY_DN12279_c0_g1~~TRINITY_DN12279_c0_g1_i1.p1  ORF type:complete len:330 (+),score=33.47 TRINITY_DN12279_c0_g1_i1:92-1081(+)
MQKIILGTMTFGAPETDERVSHSMMKTFLEELHLTHLDTAFLYEKGESENIIGRYLKQRPSDSVFVATKANPWAESGKSLTPDSVRNQLNTSLERLQRDSVDLFYLHGPDYETPIEDTLRAVNELHQEGKFKELGLSNFASWQVMNIVRICQMNGWLTPTVYQGMYNAITRNVEEELFPALSEFGLRFYAFNPLAGGLLTGRYLSVEEQPTDGRFSLKPHYKERYWKKEVFAGLTEIHKACEKYGLNMTEASFRWLTSHSLLDSAKGDGIIIGASKISHFHDNVKFCQNTEALPEEIVTAFEQAYKVGKSESPLYFKPKPSPGQQNKMK